MTTRWDKAPPEGWWPVPEDEDEHDQRDDGERFIAGLIVLVILFATFWLGYLVGSL